MLTVQSSRGVRVEAEIIIFAESDIPAFERQHVACFGIPSNIQLLKELVA